MSFNNLTFNEVLDDLSSRFIINVPVEELSSIERICFQIEQAYWYYEDFVREQNPNLPYYNLKNFSAKFFRHCPLLQKYSDKHEKAFSDFIRYKIRVPVCGAIILNEKMDKCLLVKGWSARSGWGFPKGKINKEEPDIDCAVREVMEETGYDISEFVKEGDYIELLIKEQRIRLYIVTGIPEDTHFEPQTRKEISKIKWHYVRDLPSDKRDRNSYRSNNYYLVYPFVGKLHQWISREKKARYLRKKKENVLARQSQRSNHIGESSDVEMSEFDGAVSDSGVRHADYERVTGIIPKQTGLIRFDTGTSYSSDAEATSVLRSVLGIMQEKPPLLPSQTSTSSEPLNVLNSPYMNSPKQMSYTQTSPTLFQTLPYSQASTGSTIIQSPIPVPQQFPSQYPLSGQIPLPIPMTSQFAPLAMNSPTLGLAAPLAIQPISLPSAAIPNPALYMINNEGGINPEVITSPYVVANTSSVVVNNSSIDSYVLPQQTYLNPIEDQSESSTPKLKTSSNDNTSLEKKLLDFLNNKSNDQEIRETSKPHQVKKLDGRDILNMLNANSSYNESDESSSIQRKTSKRNNNKKSILKSNNKYSDNEMKMSKSSSVHKNKPNVTLNDMLLKLLNESIGVESGDDSKNYSNKNSVEQQQYILDLFKSDNQQDKSSSIDSSPLLSHGSMNPTQQLQAKLLEMVSKSHLNLTEKSSSSTNLEASKVALLNMLTNNAKPSLLQQKSQPNTLSKSSASLLEMLNKNSASMNDISALSKSSLTSSHQSSNYKINSSNFMGNEIPSIPNMGYAKQSEYKEKGRRNSHSHNSHSHNQTSSTHNNNNNHNDGNGNNDLSALLMNMLNVSSNSTSPMVSPDATPKTSHAKKEPISRSNESSMQLLEKLNESQFSPSRGKPSNHPESLVVNEKSSQALLSMLNINTKEGRKEETTTKVQKHAPLKSNVPKGSSNKMGKETIQSNSVANQAINSLLLSLTDKNKTDNKLSVPVNQDIAQILKSSTSSIASTSNNTSQEFNAQSPSQTPKSIDLNTLFQNALNGNAISHTNNNSTTTTTTTQNQSPTFTEISVDAVDTNSIFNFNNDFITNQRKLKLNEYSRRMMNLLKVNSTTDHNSNSTTKSTTTQPVSKNPLLDVLKQGDNSSSGSLPSKVIADTNLNNNHKSTTHIPTASALNLLSLLNHQSTNSMVTDPSLSTLNHHNTSSNNNTSSNTNSAMAQNPLLALINGSSNANLMNTTANNSITNNNNSIPTGVSISVQDLFNSFNNASIALKE